MKIGIIGAGQLSRMLALSAIHMGFEFAFYDQKSSRSVVNLGEFFEGSYSDYELLTKFANQCDVITFENENIDYKSIEFLESIKPVYPGSISLKHTQNKILEKKMLEKLEIPTPLYQPVNSISEVIKFSKKSPYPFFIKRNKKGYDGKGLIKVNTLGQLLTLSEDALENSICEQLIEYDREVSIIAVTSQNGQRAYYDICENTHKNGILMKTCNKPNDLMYAKAKQYIDLVLDYLGHVGCLAFEFFQVGDNLLANELAPRVHNSGHWTIEGANTSQFENHIRAILGLPLGNSMSTSKATMLNIIGQMPDRIDVLSNDLYYLHEYQKEPMKGRKLGHITIIT